jgi:two-component system sensor histidine kinase VicK
MMSTFDDKIFQRLGDTAREAFFIYNISAHKVDYLSQGFTRLTGLSTVNITSNPNRLLDIVHPDDRDYLTAQMAAFGAQKQLKAEFRLLLNDGNGKYVQLTAYALDGDPLLAAGWLADIDNSKTNILYAEKINARKNSLLEILSHDLKEPIAMINMMASAIRRDEAIAGNVSIEKYIRIIQDLCESNIRLIRDTVEQEFSEAGEIGLRIERVDLVWAIRDIMERYAAAGEVIKKRFRFESETDRLLILMDNLKMIQVVNNLIANAIKFTADDGQITVRVSEMDSQVRITVQDDGIGIPAELHPFVFEPHTRAQRPGIRGESGSGMGLAIIRSLVELHGGKIWLDTQNTGGTTFHIELPKD